MSKNVKKADPFAERLRRKQDEETTSASAPVPAQAVVVDASPVERRSTFAQGRAEKLMTLADLPDPVETHAFGPLTSEEEQILDLCLQGVRQFEQSWWVMAKAMANINARRLYRRTHDTFESFAREAFGKSKSTAYEEITAYPVGELLSARADTLFEQDSNALSARADITKKAAIALNPITKDYGAATAVAVWESVVDATGEAVPFKKLTGIIRQLPRKASSDTTETDLTTLARKLAAEQPSPAPVGDVSADAMDALRKTVGQLGVVYRALAPAKVAAAYSADPVAAADLFVELDRVAARVAERARKAVASGSGE